MAYKDFQKKEPSKTERALYEIALRLEMTDRSTLSNAAFISAIGIALDVDPKKIAALLVSKNEEIKEYSKKINDEIDRLDKERKDKEGDQIPENS